MELRQKNRLKEYFPVCLNSTNRMKLPTKQSYPLLTSNPVVYNLFLVSNVITIDGPTSSGKSSVALMFANRIGYQYIDTGSIYRAGTYYILQHGIPMENDERVAEVFSNLEVDFKMIDGRMHTFLYGSDISDQIHSLEVTSVVPVVAAHAKAREECKKIQRRIGERQNTVMTGRDIGSEIFPDAHLKFFLTARAEIRAERRYKQIKERNPEITYDEILHDMLTRDKMDSEREASPFRKPEKAIEIDTSDMSVDDSVEALVVAFQNEFKDAKTNN